MTFQYIPTKEFIVDHVRLQFGTHRDIVRVKLGLVYEEQNQFIQINELFAPIIQRRDIYNRRNSTGDYFFLNYDKNDLLRDVEIHWCEKIQVYDFLFDFDCEIDFIAAELSKYSHINKKGDGEYFFKDIHISIIDEMHMGGEEKSTMSYFYCATDVSHLDD